MPLTSSIGTQNSLLGNIVFGLGSYASAAGSGSFSVTPELVSTLAVTLSGSATFTITLAASSTIATTFYLSYSAAASSTLTLPSSVTIPAGQLSTTFTATMGRVVDVFTITVLCHTVEPMVVYVRVVSPDLGVSPVTTATDSICMEEAYSQNITVTDSIRMEEAYSPVTSLAPTILDYAGISFGSLAISGGIYDDLGVLSTSLKLSTSSTTSIQGSLDTRLNLTATGLQSGNVSLASYLCLAYPVTGNLALQLSLLNQPTLSVATNLTLLTSGGLQLGTGLILADPTRGNLPSYLTLLEPITGFLSTALNTAYPLSGYINTDLVLNDVVGAQLNTQVTLFATSEQSLTTKLVLQVEASGSITTNLHLAYPMFTREGGDPHTQLTLYTPFEYSSNITIGQQPARLLFTEKWNSRFRGSRETAKITSQVKSVGSDLSTIEQMKDNLEVTVVATAFSTSCSQSVRSIQKYRTQISWRVRS